jgi:hypothetical protein
MRFLRSATSILRKTILIGWAFAVLWIYFGNLVNFHQNHIWGKQLIPVECSSTRIKEKDAESFVKNDRNTKTFISGLHFDFSTPAQQMPDILHPEVISLSYILPDAPLQHQGILAFSFRGPPSA